MSMQSSLMAAQREASQRVKRARKFSIRLPVVGTVRLPSPEQVAVYTALGGLAVLGVLDWPVAVAMGVGSIVVGRRLTDVEDREDELAKALKKIPAKNGEVRKAPSRKAPARRTPAKKPAKGAQ